MLCMAKAAREEVRRIGHARGVLRKRATVFLSVTCRISEARMERKNAINAAA